MAAKLNMAEDLNRIHYEELAERTIVSAMAVNPLVAMDSSQILAALGRVAGRAIGRPSVLARRTASLAQELAVILLGASNREPEASDRRFTDPTFRDHPIYRRAMQTYLAWRETLHALLEEIDLDTKSLERGRFALSLFTETVAPTNFLVGNPAALKRAFETSGMSLVRGLRHFVADMIEGNGMPAQVDRRPFKLGVNLACTAGQVVFRNDVLELIQYAPSTPKVYERPLFFVPPQINKFYFLDLAPGRSLIEYVVAQGYQAFLVSWRNPTPAQREWGLDAYISALVEAIDVTREITGSEDVNLLGACAGGITSAVLLGHLAARGRDVVNSASFVVTVLDLAADMTIGALTSEKTIAASIRRSRKQGILAGSELARVFAWLRPNDLVWNYFVNNYLLGNDPAAFDILAWNSDSTNLPAALHAEFLDVFEKNHLAERGTLSVLETPIDLKRVKCDIYATGALTDHLTPWDACYRSPMLFDGKVTFVASNSGHIQSIVNPPGNLKSKFYVNEAVGLDPQTWLERAKEHKGTWWKHWTDWLAKRSGGEKPAPEALGSEVHPQITAAPGRYVHQRANA